MSSAVGSHRSNQTTADGSARWSETSAMGEALGFQDALAVQAGTVHKRQDRAAWRARQGGRRAGHRPEASSLVKD
jgi:hypothetical protein